MPFNRFAETVSVHVSRAWFFALVLVAVVAWIPTVFLFSTGVSDLIVDAISNPLSLLLLVLLHNSSFRAERASDQRSDHLAEAIAEILQQLAHDEPDEARRTRLEERAADLVHVSREQSAFQTRGEPSADGGEDDRGASRTG